MDVTIVNGDGENGGKVESTLSPSSSAPASAAAHGCHDDLVIPLGGTNSACASVEDNMDVTIVNGDGENGGNVESTLSSSSSSTSEAVTRNGNPFGGKLWTQRIQENSCCKDSEEILKPNYKERGGGARHSRRCGARRHRHGVGRA